MNFIVVNEENVEREHICCAITDAKGETCVSSKKAWLRERFREGLVFLKLDARGKVFIEYIPAEHTWCPIDADGYLHVNCLWVSGQFQGKGLADELLDQCIADAKAKGKRGLTAVASEKKRTFLSDAGYLKHRGFRIADTASPYFALYYLPFEEPEKAELSSGAHPVPIPSFRPCAKAGRIAETGMVLYYTNQCPHTDKYVPLIAKIAQERGVSLDVRKITSLEQAKQSPSAVTTYAFFDNGAFVSNEIMSEKKFEKYLDAKGL